ncbi:MAG: hypothetical protein WCI56_02815 [Hyphomicrobiales bacterium]
MTFDDPIEFADQCEAYVQEVGMFLAEKIGQEAADACVVDRLSLVLQAMFDGARADNIAGVLVSKSKA